MPDGPQSRERAPATSPAVLVEPGSSSPRVMPAAYPLDDFYARAGLPLPALEMVEPFQIPEPHRSLLVHNHDMTPTLSAYHARVIQLRVLSREYRGDFYFREVILFGEGSDAPVEFGAIRINLALFAPAARRHILDERVPLGDLLRVHAVPHSSRPKAFFRLQSDALMVQALQLREPTVLYGRRNTLLDPVQRPLAEVVEILPPLAPAAPGYLCSTDYASDQAH